MELQTTRRRRRRRPVIRRACFWIERDRRRRDGRRRGRKNRGCHDGIRNNIITTSRVYRY